MGEILHPKVAVGPALRWTQANCRPSSSINETRYHMGAFAISDLLHETMSVAVDLQDSSYQHVRHFMVVASLILLIAVKTFKANAAASSVKIHDF